MWDLTERAGFTGPEAAHWAGLADLSVVARDGGLWLYAASAATGGYRSFALAEDRAAVMQGTVTIDTADAPAGASFRISDVVQVTLDGQQRLIAAALDSGILDCQTLRAQGGMARSSPLQASAANSGVAAMTSLVIGDHTFLALASRDSGQLRLYQLGSGWRLTETALAVDGPKSTLAGVSDLLTVEQGGRHFLIAASTTQDGLSVFLAGADGSLSQTDMIGTRDGLWVAGLDGLASLEVGGTCFLIGASIRTSSLSVLRLNDLGVLFVTDEVIDDGATRIGHVAAMATFAQAGRGFLLAGGDDGGLSLFEMLPDGTLHLARSYELAADWTTGPVAGLAVAQLGDEVQVFYSSATAPGLSQLVLSLAGLAPMRRGGRGADRLEGGGGQDLLFGAAGDDTLIGGGGDDVLVGGPGRNWLSGGAGADEFVLTAAAGQQSVIRDFQHGRDRINLDDWGRLYDLSALTVQPRSYGAEILWQDQSLRIETDNRQSLTAADWTAADFLF